jgi:hypothetical protein
VEREREGGRETQQVAPNVEMLITMVKYFCLDKCLALMFIGFKRGGEIYGNRDEKLVCDCG